MELKRKLTSLRKASSDFMKKYLRDIKIFVDSLAVINSPVSNANLIEHTLMGLGTEYESLIVIFLNAPIAPSSSTSLGFCGYTSLIGGRDRFKGGRWGGRSKPSSGRGSFPGQASRPFKGILGDRPPSIPDRSDGSNEAVWYPDSGAASHMTNTDDLCGFIQ
ncbi:hypothetical protein AKJ16_DCAP24837 [Drosera capensis]